MKKSTLLALFVVVSPLTSLAQQAAPFQYAVKFVCGASPGQVVAPGVYYTAINVHNPGEKPVPFRKKFAIALPSERAGRVTAYFEAKLGPDQALEIDCPDIFRHADTKRFLKGFAVIESEVELDIVAVYTTTGVSERAGTFFMERVPPRRR